MNTHESVNGAAERPDRQYERFKEIVANISFVRREVFSKLLDRRRDLGAACGFPDTQEMTPEKWHHLHERDGLAARVNEAMVKEAFQVRPSVYETEDSDTPTEFEDVWDSLGRQTTGEPGHYAQEKDSRIWTYVKRLMIQARINRYAILLFGFDDARAGDSNALAKPVEPVKWSKTKSRKVLYFRVFPERLAPITKWDTDPASPRFGQPVTYSVTFSDPLSGQYAEAAYAGPQSVTKNVHFSRVLHYAPNLTTSEWLGNPECLAVLNYLLSAQKVYGASGEGYWKSCFTALSIESNPQLGPDVQYNEEKMKDLFEDWQNDLQRVFALVGFSAKTIAPSVVDPTPHLNAQIEAIAINKGMPVRILKGSERGELASSQDDAAWNDRVAEFQSDEITPRVIVPFVDRLINVGVLPTPGDGYLIDWPPIESQSETDKASVAQTKTGALATYAQSGVDAIVPPMDYLTRILGMSEEEATAVLDNATDQMEGDRAGGSTTLATAAGVTALIAAFAAAKDGAVSEGQLKEILITGFKLSEELADAVIADGLTPAAQDAGDPPPPPPPVMALPGAGPGGGKPAFGKPPGPGGGGPPKPGQPAPAAKPNPFAKPPAGGNGGGA